MLNNKYYVGIDLGGTFIKGGIVDDLGNIIYSDKIGSTLFPSLNCG